MKAWMRCALALTVGLLLSVGSASAALVAGRDYVVLAKPMPVKSGNKIEVIEVFWYGCPHCYRLDPLLNQWIGKLPADVSFRRVPAAFANNPSWSPLARLYYALEDTGELRLHPEVFDAVHRDHINLNNPNLLREWLASKTMSGARIAQSMNSPKVNANLANSIKYVADAKIDGVPTIVIDGKYATGAEKLGEGEALINAVNELIAKARAERKTAAKPAAKSATTPAATATAKK